MSFNREDPAAIEAEFLALQEVNSKGHAKELASTEPAELFNELQKAKLLDEFNRLKAILPKTYTEAEHGADLQRKQLEVCDAIYMEIMTHPLTAMHMQEFINQLKQRIQGGH